MPQPTIRQHHFVQSPIRNIQFVICTAAEEDSDLEVWKAYRILPDSKADEVGSFQAIDEFGEDSSYPQTQFVAVDLPDTVRVQLMAEVGC